MQKEKYQNKKTVKSKVEKFLKQNPKLVNEFNLKSSKYKNRASN